MTKDPKKKDGVGTALHKRLEKDAHKLKEDVGTVAKRLQEDAEKLKQAVTDSPLSLSAVSYIEKLSQKKGANTSEERFKVVPDYAYPNTRMNREELRLEMNKKSSYFHILQQPDDPEQPVGQLFCEILQCFGLPKTEVLGEASDFCVLVCGKHAFKTDVMPPVANPMWLRKMRRACVVPLLHAYARVYIGVFGQQDNRDGFAGRVLLGKLFSHYRFFFRTFLINLPTDPLHSVSAGLPFFNVLGTSLSDILDLSTVLDVARLRPGCTYDVTIPLRQSAHVYSREQRGAIRLRFYLEWKSERAALTSYLPRKMPKIQPNESVTIQCCDAKSFQNVARVVHGTHMPGRFTTRQLKATVREINFTRIHVLRYIRKREVRNTIEWRYPIISAFVFLAWMHSVYVGTLAYVPGHLLTLLLLHLWKNYVKYGIESPVQNGFPAPSWEEMFAALVTGKHFISPLEMERKDEAQAKSALQDMDTSSATPLQTIDESAALLNVIAEAFRREVKVKDHRYHLRMYHNVFKGNDAVDYLVDAGYAGTRVEAVAIGGRLMSELNLFEHISGTSTHGFKDEPLFYTFSSYDANEYTIKTHRPRGKWLFRMLGFWPVERESEEKAHLEMPYATGGDHPRFTVKESVVIRSKSGQRLLEQEMEGSQAETFEEGLDTLLEEDDKNDTTENNASMEFDGANDENGNMIEVTQLKKPPQQDLDVIIKGDRKIADVLAEARHKVHAVLLHLFNDRVYKINEPIEKNKIKKSGISSQEQLSTTSSPSRRVRIDRTKSKRNSSDASRKDEYDKLLATGKYSHGNPWIAKVGIIIQPIVEIALEWLCLFRALFNIFTWRDPMLSFWFSILGPVVVIVLHLFPWRIVFGVAGMLFFGPQNWLLRVVREHRDSYQPPDPDKIIKKKPVVNGQEDEIMKASPLFSDFAPDNRQLWDTDFDSASSVREIVVPDSRLMYQRFYDWPPENEYARVEAEDPPASDAGVDFDSLRAGSSSWDGTRRESTSRSRGKVFRKTRNVLSALTKPRFRKKVSTY